MVKLFARAPWQIACRANDRLLEIDTEAGLQDWELYWVAGITALRAIWHVFTEQDRSHGDHAEKIVADFKKTEWISQSPILEKFARDSRDLTIKQWKFPVQPQPYTYRPFLTPEDPGEAARRSGRGTTLEYSDEDGDEDALRLFQIALVDWHEYLSIAEMALEEGIANPFSSTARSRKSLLEKSRFLADYPNTPHL